MNAKSWMTIAAGLVLAAGAVGCGSPQLTGDTRVIYQSGAQTGKHGRSKGSRMVLVHRGNEKYVDHEGVLLEPDRATKVVSDALLAEVVGRILDAGFNTYAEGVPGDGPVLPVGSRSVLVLEIGGQSRRITTPYPDGGIAFANAFRSMIAEILDAHQNSTTFHAASGNSDTDRPNWKTSSSFGGGR